MQNIYFLLTKGINFYKIILEKSDIFCLIKSKNMHNPFRVGESCFKNIEIKGFVLSLYKNPTIVSKWLHGGVSIEPSCIMMLYCNFNSLQQTIYKSCVICFFFMFEFVELSINLSTNLLMVSHNDIIKQNNAFQRN